MPEISIDQTTGRRILIDDGTVYHPKDALEQRRLENELGSWDYPVGETDVRFVKALLAFWGEVRGERGWEVSGQPDDRPELQNRKTPDFECRERFSGRTALVELKALPWELQGEKWIKGFADFFSEASCRLQKKLPGTFRLLSLEKVSLDFTGKKRERLLSKFVERVLDAAADMKDEAIVSFDAPFHVKIHKLSSKGSYLDTTGRFQRITDEGMVSEMERLLAQANEKFPSDDHCRRVLVFQWPYKGYLQNLGMKAAFDTSLASVDTTTHPNIDEIYVCSEGSGYPYFDLVQIYPRSMDVVSVKIEES